MKVQNDCLVSIDYRLTSDTGDVLDESVERCPLSFVFGRGQMVPGLEQQIEGMEIGERAEFVVEPEEGYGPVREDLFRDIERESFPEDIDLQPGQYLRARSPHGPMMLKIQSVQNDSVTVDLNHPFAGLRLHFNVQIVESRAATDEEIMATFSHCCLSDCSGCCGGCH